MKNIMLAKRHNKTSSFIRTYNNKFKLVRNVSADEIIEMAKALLIRDLKTFSVALDNPAKVKDYLTLELINEDTEIFCIAFLNTQNKLISFERMFRGTINTSNVFPREIAKRAIVLNASALILVHNHPSGNSEPSSADLALTKELTSIFELLNTKIVDHFIIGHDKVFSFAENGCLY